MLLPVAYVTVIPRLDASSRSWQILFFRRSGYVLEIVGSFDRAKDESDVARGRKVNSAFRVVERDRIATPL